MNPSLKDAGGYPVLFDAELRADFPDDEGRPIFIAKTFLCLDSALLQLSLICGPWQTWKSLDRLPPGARHDKATGAYSLPASYWSRRHSRFEPTRCILNAALDGDGRVSYYSLASVPLPEARFLHLRDRYSVERLLKLIRDAETFSGELPLRPGGPGPRLVYSR